MIGPGGAGKSSLLRGLMDLKLKIAESTRFADALELKCQMAHGGASASLPWHELGNEDALNELAHYIAILPESAQDNPSTSPQLAPADSNEQYQTKPQDLAKPDDQGRPPDLANINPHDQSSPPDLANINPHDQSSPPDLANTSHDQASPPNLANTSHDQAKSHDQAQNAIDEIMQDVQPWIEKI